MKRLAGRVAVVTGAGSGIGRATSEALARHGCDVALVDVDEGRLAEVADRVRGAGRKASLHVADVADRERMRALPDEVVREHGRVHVLMNNAGVSVGSELLDHDLEDFDWIVGINFWGVVYGCKFFLPLLLEQDEAHIVNVSSMFGFLGIPGQTSYCATKFAVRGFSEALHAELRGSAVGVSSVHPGAIQTRIVHASRIRDEAERERVIDLFERRGSPPERVARAVVRGILRNRFRVLVTPEARISDWAKRLAPVWTQRLIAWRAQSLQNPLAGAPGSRGDR